MDGAWVVNMTHFLDREGQVGRLPAPARRLADYFGAIVSSVCSHPPEMAILTGIKCRRRPRRKICLGVVLAVIDPDTSEIHWECSACRDHGLISGWKGSPWDKNQKPEC